MELNVTVNSETVFSKIEMGEVFYFDGDFYMKIRPHYGNTDNAIHLSSGSFDDFDDCDEVTKVKATLNIEM